MFWERPHGSGVSGFHLAESTGHLCGVAFAPALMTYLAPFLLSSPDLPSDTQPAKVRLLSIPYVHPSRTSCSDGI